MVDVSGQWWNEPADFGAEPAAQPIAQPAGALTASAAPAVDQMYSMVPAPAATAAPTGALTAAANTPAAVPDYSNATIDEYGNYFDQYGNTMAPPPVPTYDYSFNVMSNKNNPTGLVNVNANTPLALIDNRTGQLVYSGTGVDAAKQIQQMAADLTAQGGNKATWSIYSAPAGATDASQFQQVAYEKPNKSLLSQAGGYLKAAGAGFLVGGPIGAAAGVGAHAAGIDDEIVRYGLPIALSLTPLGPVAGSAIGSGLGSLYSGDSVTDALKSAAVSAATAGVVQGTGLDKVLGSALSKVPGASGALSSISSVANEAYQNVFNNAIAQGLSNSAATAAAKTAADGIIVNGIKTLGSSAATGALSSALGGATAPKPTNWYDASTVSPDDLIAIGDKTLTNASGALTGGAGASVSDLVVNANKALPPAENATDALVSDLVVNANKNVPATDALVSDIVVNAINNDPQKATTGATSTLLSDLITQQQTDAEAKKKTIGTTAENILAGLAAAASANKGTGTGTTSPGGQALQNVFSAKLPRASGIFANLAPRDMSGTDWSRYGYGPEKAFFQNVPTNAAERQSLVSAYRPSQLNLSGTGGTTTSPTASTLTQLLQNALPQATTADIEAFLATPEGQNIASQILAMSGQTAAMSHGGMLAAKRGGDSHRGAFAVNGPGTGRSDDIPAVLSDGEYVLDAETVALLGDGSSKAGADKLDKMRINIRKHKGRNLAKGKFSVNAKAPDAYLSGGRI